MTPHITSESVVSPLIPVVFREHSTQFPIPDNAKTAVVALRCNFIEDGRLLQKLGRQCMRIVKVMDVGMNR